MKKFILLVDSNKKMYVCGNNKTSVEWEISKGKTPIGTIETDLTILELKNYIGGVM